MAANSLKDLIKAGKSNVFRRCFIKRRPIATGLFESDWQDITSDVKKWGKIKYSIDAVRLNKFKFNAMKMTFANDEGKYNPEDDDASLWFNYLTQQRTLVKIEAGLSSKIQGSDNRWHYTEYPNNTRWDISRWDTISAWDSNNVAFVGIISGDISVSDKNDVSFNIKPLTQIFRDYAARNLTGYTSTGLTAQDFVEMIRDQTDGAGSFVFRPFFGDTSTNWNIDSTSIIYSDLNTSGAEGVRDKTVWQIVESLAEAENFIPYVGNDGTFNFKTRSPTTTVQYQFFGAGAQDPEWGHTIKSIKRYAPRYSKYYSRVEVQWNSDNTETSLEVVESSITVGPGNATWSLGQRTFKISNFFIPNANIAGSIAQTIFNDYSSTRRELDFETSFIPHLNLTDRIQVSYDSTKTLDKNLWDLNDWADTSGAALTGKELEWDKSTGDAIKMNNKEFRLLSIDVDLDKLSTKFVAREF